MIIIGYIFLTIGAAFLFLGGLGILRMPDVLNQSQAGTKASTLGIVAFLIGLIFFHPDWGFKLMIISVFFLATAPIASHKITRAALLRNKENFILSENAFADHLKEEEQEGDQNDDDIIS
ncbi:MAG: monovalent cation/H(+) antiporter subunit G [Peptostreptococcaceae bacterium]|nr:monovalent cation/H(+) antiporter subunit G [Peptostreptococcaceae bacterium]